MLDRDVVFDATSNQIGFADADCAFKASRVDGSVSDTATTPSAVANSSRESSTSLGVRAAGDSSSDSAQESNAQLSTVTSAQRSDAKTFVISGIVCVALVAIALAFLWRRQRAKRRALATRSSRSNSRDTLDRPSAYIDDNESDDDPKASFVTPHFILLHSPSSEVTAPSPRNDQFDDASGLMLMHSPLRQSRRTSAGLHRVEL